MASSAVSRQAQIDLATLALRDLQAVWPTLAAMTPADARAALMEILPALGDQYGDAAAALAAEWYDQARDAASVRGAYRAAPSGPVTRARWEALARWGVDPLFGASPDPASALALISGGLQRTVADRHRLTVVENSIRDPQAKGWRRVGVGASCGFCRMLIDRGNVYTDATVTFRSHDNCNCAASPAWDDKIVKVSREPYRQSQRHRSEEQKARDNARARTYIAEQYGDT